MDISIQALLPMLVLAFVAAQGNEPDEDDFDSEYIDIIQKGAVPLNMDEIQRKFVYPKPCVRKGIQGQVIVRARVGKDGAIEKLIVKNSPHILMSEEVERVFSELMFAPAELNGRPIITWVIIPINFSLNQSKRPETIVTAIVLFICYLIAELVFEFVL